MTKHATYFLAAILLLIGQSVMAAEKIAVVDARKALFSTEAFKVFQSQLQQDLAADTQSFDKMRKELDSIRAKIEKDQAVLSKAEIRKIKQQQELKVADLKHLQSKIAKARQDRIQEWIRKMQPKMDKAFKGLVSKEKYTLVLRKEATLHVNDAHDITEKVTEAFDAAS